uniref:Doublecortin domain containing 2B n=1 Tax=Seriola dumerili TaxID=41447 RepID=A0A3B4UYH6_SERDU
MASRKFVMVYRNGDPFYNGRRFVVNQRQVATMEAFLNEVTQNIGAPLAVRTLYTPRQGHRVTDLQDLQTGAQYVAAVEKPFTDVFRNGDLLCPPFRFIIPRSMQQDLEQILSLVTEKVSLRTGAVRRLCSLEGATVSSAGELETGHCYVAVGTERFKKLPYVELSSVSVCKDTCWCASVLAILKAAAAFRCLFITVQPSVFKRAARRRRDEVRGAEEVKEDENTATELPVDQVNVPVISVFIKSYTCVVQYCY